jgi:hypothetical protein
VTGLDNLSKPLPRLKKHAAVKAAAVKKARFNNAALTPTQTRTLYGVAPMYSAGFQGLGKNIAISSYDGFKLSNVPLYYKQFNLPSPAAGVGSNITVVTVGTGSATATPGGEADLDIQMVLGMAPLCSFTIYDGAGNILDVLTKEQNDNTADIISESYGWLLPASVAQSCHNEHVLMSAQGITYMEATGDYGTSLEPYAYSNYEPDCFQVGGSIANTDSAGNRTSEVGWSGSGGGWATESVPFNVLPTWQKGKGVPTNINYRLNPDVALNAAGDSTGAYQFYFGGALNQEFDGTSFASPVFAGCLGITEQKIVALGGKKRLGRIADTIYAQNGRADVWYDDISGINGILPSGSLSQATPFWDTVTGWGAPNFLKLAQTIAVSPAITFAPSTIGIYYNTGLNPAVVEGTNGTGSASSLSSIDGVGYSIKAVPEAIGKVASATVAFNTTLDPAKTVSLAFSLEGSAVPEATISFYVLNQATAKFDLVTSVSGTAFASATININARSLAKYVSGTGKVQVLVRYLVPTSRLRQVTNFTMLIDQIRLTAIQGLD